MKKMSAIRELHGLKLVCFLAGLLLVGSACSSEPSVREMRNTEPLAASNAAAETQPQESVDSTVEETQPEVTNDESAPQVSDSSGKKISKKDNGPVPVNFPWKNEVPLKATLSARCVDGGESMTLTVETKPEAAIVYQAVYSDNLGGAPKPLGGGYGGNDKGYADANGEWSSTWVVSPTAPAGKARVDVVVGWDQKWGYDGPEFAVASKGGCGS